MPTYSRFPIVINHGKGSYIFDKEGKKYLDLVGGLATVPIGHGNEGLANTLKNQTKQLINITNLFYTEQQTILAEKLAKLTNLEKAFFSNSGSEANEVAIKLARKVKNKPEIISTEQAFHGRTMGALSATHKKKYKEYCEPLIPHFKHIPYNNIEALKKAITSNTAAFIVEPIQGEAGIIIPDKDYLKKVEKICKENNILLIMDEVQTCLRTGKFLALQHSNIKPDIVTLAKGIANGVPIGITLAKKEIADAFEPGDQGSTFGGNSLSCAAANFVVNFIEKNKLIEKGAKMGNYFKEKLNELKNKHNSIKEIRAIGLMIAVETNKSSKDIVNKCLKESLLVNPVSETAIRFLPPLTIEKKEIDEAINILDKVFSQNI